MKINVGRAEKMRQIMFDVIKTVTHN